jgi:hypothetical protein
MARFVVCLACLVAFSSRSSAAVVIDIKEVGGNVVASTTGGTLNVNGLNFSNSNPGGGLIRNNLFLVGSGGLDIYNGSIAISAPFAPGLSHVLASSNTGPSFGFGISNVNVGSGLLGIPSGAVSTSSGVYAIEAASSTFNSRTFSSLNLTPGTYTVSWGSNGNSDSITLNVGEVGPSGEVPEPASAVIAGLLLAASALRRRSKRVADG